jgi:L-threonylcarbamoyladenylate synthase
VAAQLGSKIPMILDGGACGVGVESTIIGFENGQSYVYRLGGLAVEALENVLGKVELRLNQSSNPAAPGQLKSHYAPRKPFFVTHDVDSEIRKIIDNQVVKNIENIAVVNFDNYSTLISMQHQIVLSHAGDLHEAAKNLFAAMRQLDALPDVEMIVAQWLPNISLGRALNDRLRRAATPTHD